MGVGRGIMGRRGQPEGGGTGGVSQRVVALMGLHASTQQAEWHGCKGAKRNDACTAG